MKIKTSLTVLVCILFVTACNTTKFVRDGDYLLDKVSINSDSKKIDTDQLSQYVRQTPNAGVFGLWRMQLNIYNLAPKDTTNGVKRAFRKLFHKIGDPPVVFSPELTSLSVQQLQRQISNKGYMDCKVDTKVNYKGKKASVEYSITSGTPYRLGEYVVNLKNDALGRVAKDTTRSFIKPEMLFDADVLGSERDRIATVFRRFGYYNFNKDYISYIADSTNNNHHINLSMGIRELVKNSGDSINNLIFKKYTIRQVIYYVSEDLKNSAEMNVQIKPDTVHFRNFVLISPTKRLLKLDALVQNTYINPNTLFTDDAVEKTYQALNTLGPIKYVNISFKDVGDGLLDCNIVINPNKTISLTAEAEGTNTGGYWGGIFKLSYTDKNIFNGAEALSIQGRSSFEYQGSVWAKEFGAQAGIKFPRFIFPVGSYDFKRNIHANTEFTGSYNYMNRPNEFITTNISAGLNYSWKRRRFQHNFQLFGISFVQFPYKDPNFVEDYINSGRYNSYNYTNHFIMNWSYSGSNTSYNASRPLQNYSTSRYSIETAGNLLSLLCMMSGVKKTESAQGDKAFELFNIRFSQYVKVEYNLTHHQIFDKDNQVVYHIGLGAGVPYGNASSIPYEKRFYAGGANSIRGWGEAMLGPGAYSRNSFGYSRDFNQVGDIKMEGNIELRDKLFWRLEGAFFFDAGNIWTIKNYSEQPLGQFKINDFYNQIALAYGLGLRVDMSFFIMRLDIGCKLFDPSYEKRADQWRLPPNYGKDIAWHIAIGYPF